MKQNCFPLKLAYGKTQKNILVAVNIKSVPKTGHEFEPQLFKNKKNGSSRPSIQC